MTPSVQAQPLRFGLLPPIVQPINRRAWEETASVDDLKRVVLAAEAAGFDFLTCFDHSAVPVEQRQRYGQLRFFDPIATFGFMAALTSRIRFLTYVLVLPLRSPLVTAKAMATLDRLSNGRINIGLGTGGVRKELEAAGIPFEQRGKVLTDYIPALVALLSQDPASYDGEFCKFTDLVIQPRPVQRPHPPILVGGRSPQTFTRAARFGQGWIPWDAERDEVARGLVRLRDMPEFAAKAATFQVLTNIAPLGGRGPLGQEPPAIARPSHDMAQQALETIAHWRAAGATGFVVDVPATSLGELLEDLDWFAREVIPQSV